MSRESIAICSLALIDEYGIKNMLLKKNLGGLLAFLDLRILKEESFFTLKSSPSSAPCFLVRLNGSENGTRKFWTISLAFITILSPTPNCLVVLESFSSFRSDFLHKKLIKKSKKKPKKQEQILNKTDSRHASKVALTICSDLYHRKISSKPYDGNSH